MIDTEKQTPDLHDPRIRYATLLSAFGEVEYTIIKYQAALEDLRTQRSDILYELEAAETHVNHYVDNLPKANVETPKESE